MTLQLQAERPTTTFDVFISYRRVETSYAAGWLHEYFASRLGQGRVFLDIDAIRPGLDFMSIIQSAVTTAKVMLVLIGPRWAIQADGRSRLADPSDPVRVEVESALARDLLVIPLLLDDAQMPTRDRLPSSMARLAELNAVRISRDLFRQQLDSLLEVIANVLPEATDLSPPGDPPPLPARVAAAATGDLDGKQRPRLLSKLSSIYEDVLRQALHDDQVVEMPLQLRERPEKVRRLTDILLPHGRSTDRLVGEGATLLDVLDEHGGMDGDGLLILGEPGAGKSTALVALAAELLVRAQRDPHHPVPVYLPLKHWGMRRLPLSTWLVQELVDLYEMPRALAQRWTSEGQLFFLLDGLDELPRREDRIACVAGISSFQRFGREHRLPLIVAARPYEYDTLPEPLELENAIEILPLQPDAVERRLADAGSPMRGVLEVIRGDATTRSMLPSPLLLSLITRTYAGRVGSRAAAQAVDGNHLSGLFASYVEERFALEQSTRDNRKNSFRPTATRRWLSWLAAAMTEKQQSIFVLGQLSADWLPGKADRWFVKLLPGLVFGMTFLIPVGLIGSKDVAIRSCLVVTLGAGLAVGRASIFATPTPVRWTWSWSAALASVAASAAVALALSLALNVLDTTGSGVARILERFVGVGIALMVLAGVELSPDPGGKQLPGRRPALQWAICVGLVLALATGIARTITSGPAEGGRVAVSWAILGGAGAWLTANSGPAERVSWSWRRATKSMWSACTLATVCGIAVFAGFGLFAGPKNGLYAGATVATCAMVSTLLVAGFDRASIQVYVTPNEATRRSFLSGLLIGTIAFLLFAIAVAGLMLLLTVGRPDLRLALAASIAFGFPIAVVIALTFGIGSVAQHWLTRVFLWRSAVAPLRYGRWLNYVVSLKLLYRTGGGGYVFVHGLMQEYFTQREDHFGGNREEGN
jgi:hypothetical protein